MVILRVLLGNNVLVLFCFFAIWEQMLEFGLTTDLGLRLSQSGDILHKNLEFWILASCLKAKFAFPVKLT